MTDSNSRNHVGPRRRDVLLAGAALAVGACAPVAVAPASLNPSAPVIPKGNPKMSTIRTRDNTTIFYKDWGEGQPIVFSHGWPLNGDAWNEQLLFFAARGFR